VAAYDVVVDGAAQASICSQCGSHAQALQHIKAGSYRLVAIAYGFYTANVPLIITDSTPHKRLVLHMKMAEIDVCSFGGYK
jgi:hypothetical protein